MEWITRDLAGNFLINCDSIGIERWAPGASSGTVIAGGVAWNQPNWDLMIPRSMLQQADGSLIVAEEGMHRVVSVAPDGTVTILFGGFGMNGELDKMFSPKGMAQDAAGNLYVAETGHKRVCKWAPGATSCTVVAGGAGAGTGPGQLNDPHDVVLDSAGNLFVTDNWRLTKWTPGSLTGQTLVGSGTQGSSAAGLNEFGQPGAMAIDSSDNIYIGDSGLNYYRVVVWSPGATQLVVVKSSVNQPFGLVAGPNELYIADKWTGEILRCGLAGAIGPATETATSTLIKTTTSVTTARTRTFSTSTGLSSTRTTATGTKTSATATSTVTSTITTSSSTSATTTTTTSATVTLPQYPPCADAATPTATVTCLLAALLQWSQGLWVKLLRQGKAGEVRQSFPSANVTAATSPWREPAGFSVHAEGDGVEASLPASLFAKLPPSTAVEDEISVTVAAMDVTNTSSEETKVVAAIWIELAYLVSLERPSVTALEDPVLFKPGAVYTEGMTCAYWDEERLMWSNQGVEVDDSSVVGQPLVCRSYHLSLFAALLQGFQDTLQCANFRLMTGDAVAAMFKGDWHKGSGTVVYWSVLAVLLAFFLLSARQDRLRSAKGTWQDSFLLVPRFSGPAQIGEVRANVLEDDDDEVGEASWTSTGVAQAAAGCSYCKGSGAARDALDDIMANFFEYFSEVRSLVEMLTEGMDLSSVNRPGRCLHLSERAMVRMTLTSSQRLAAFSAGLSHDTVLLVLYEQEVHDMVVANRHASRAEESHSGHELARTAANATWTQLYGELCPQVEFNTFRLHGSRHTLAAIVRLFIFHNPLYSLLLFDPMVSCKMRAFFFALELLGAFLLTAVFFEASGEMKARGLSAQCGGGQLTEHFAYKIGRLVAIGLASLLLAELPVVFLNSLTTRAFKTMEYPGCAAWQRQLRAWRFQDAAILVMGSLYMAFAVFFVNLFLANLSEEDHRGFMIAALVSLLQEMVIMPALMALFLPSLAAIFFAVNRKCGKMGKDQLLRVLGTALHTETNVMLAREHL